MDIKKLALKLSIVAIGCLAFLSSCTRHPTVEEMAVLEGYIAEAEASESKVEDLEQEKARLEAELASEQQVLADHEAEFEELKRRMQERQNETTN